MDRGGTRERAFVRRANKTVYSTILSIDKSDGVVGIQAITTLTIHPSKREWNIHEFKKNMELKAKKDGDEDKERGEMVWQFLARPASFLCFHFRASVRPPKAQTHLKLP